MNIRNIMQFEEYMFIMNIINNLVYVKLNIEFKLEYYC